MTPTQRTLKKLRSEGYMAAVVEGRCEWCGCHFLKPRRGKPYRFCSRSCGVRGRSGPTKRRRVELTCATCNRHYELKASHAATSVYCSVECHRLGRDMSGNRNPNWKDSGRRTCDACGGEYKSYVKSRRYCSEKCGWDNAPGESMANQRRGYDAELKCMAELNSRGYLAFRTAASRGPFDVYAIGEGGVICVQVKRTKDPSRKRHRKAVEAISKVGAPASEHNRKQMWCWVDRKGWFAADIQPDGTVKEGWGIDWLGLNEPISPELELIRD